MGLLCLTNSLKVIRLVCQNYPLTFNTSNNRLKYIAFPTLFIYPNNFWRGVRVVEGARLESVYTVKRIAGSNPALSAKFILSTLHTSSLTYIFCLCATDQPFLKIRHLAIFYKAGY